MSSTTKRLPRFRRKGEEIRQFKLTARDLEIIRQVARHRFLSSPQICALVEGAHTQIIRRLQCLFHAGYLDRPRCQLDYYHAGGSRAMVYGLASRGAGAVRQKFDLPFSRMDWDTKNRNVGRIFLEHALMTAEILIAFELACRASGGRVKLVLPDDTAKSAGSDRPSKHKPWHQWRTTLGGKSQHLIPDAAFILEYANEPAGKNRRLCFIEADRGTMPLKRSRGSASCIERKLRLYTQLWKAGTFAEKTGAHRIQVWIVTTGAERVANMKQAFAELPSGRGLFRFTEMAALQDAEFLLGEK
jgi:Replication-relaxation